MIPFNKPIMSDQGQCYVQDVVSCAYKLSGDGEFTKKCHQWIESQTGTAKCLLTTSGTAALEMAAILMDIQTGDEVIMPSYTFVSTANAFLLRGAKIVFVDIRPDTMNIDETYIEAAITPKTKAIVVVHYAGVACEMDTIMQIAKKYNLLVCEDAAQAVMSQYKGRALGSIGHLGCYSFHETKNYTMGEGGALLVNDKSLVLRAEIIREKGTNRTRFFRGEVDKYSWCDIGSSYLPSDILAAYLYGQLEEADVINQKRLALWNIYYQELRAVKHIELPVISHGCVHNAHMFYVKCKDIDERSKLITFLKDNGVHTVFHYIPLHSSEFGAKNSIFAGKDYFTTKESERLLRLPMYYDLSEKDVLYISRLITQFYFKSEGDCEYFQR